MYEDLEVYVWVDLACRDDELDELDHGLLVEILCKDELVLNERRRAYSNVNDEHDARKLGERSP